MSGFKKLYDRIFLGHPMLSLLVLAIIGGFFGWQARNFKLDASSDSLILEGDADLRYYELIHREYPSDDYLIVTYTPRDELLKRETLNRLDEMIGELSKLDRVSSVQSALDAPLFASPKVPLLMLATGYQTLRKDTVDLALAKAELTNSPLYKNFLISKDGKTTGLLINFEKDETYSALSERRSDLRAKKHESGLTPQEQAELQSVEVEYRLTSTVKAAVWSGDVAAVREVLARYGDEAQIYLGGVPMIAADMVDFVKSDLVVFGIGVLVFLISTLGVIFRKMRWVLLPMVTCVMAGLVMVGFLGLVDWRATVISSNFISLLFIITMSMAIHFIVRYRELYHLFPDYSHRQLVLEAACQVSRPCLYCALTTMVGFGSLVFSGILPVMEFGKMMSMGIGVAYLLCFSLLPSLLVLFSKGGGGKARTASFSLTESFARFSEHKGGVLLVIALILGLLGVLGIERLTIENKFIDYFKDSTEIHAGMEVIDTQLGGTTPLEIILEGEGEDYWFKPENRARLRQIHDYLDGMPETGKVLSLDTLLKVSEDINGGKPLNSFLLLSLRKFIPEDMKQAVIYPYVSPDFSQARIVVRVVESYPELRREALLGNIRQFLTNTMDLDESEYRITGMYVLYNNMLQSLFSSQIKTIGAVFLATWLMFFILFRSFYLATIGLIPNIFPVIIVLGALGWLGIPLDMMTITIAAITIGIAVDHTIHYIHRFKTEFPKDRDYVACMHRCHNSIGVAMYYTSITIIAGFSILALSNFVPTIYFGLFTGLAMTVALLGAMTLLPKLMIILKPLGR